MNYYFAPLYIFCLLISICNPLFSYGKDAKILNVSYDPTREFYKELNEVFTQFWQNKRGEKVEVQMSHGGSGQQARSVIHGLEADVVTLALAGDIDEIAKAKKLPTDWQNRLPNKSCPYTSTIVFLVRKGNPKKINDWDDLVRSNVQIITPNPKTSGAARWAYLAAWGYAAEKFADDEGKILKFMSSLYRNVPVFGVGARGATNIFAQRGIGDVLLSWENEAFLVLKQLGEDSFEIVYPSISVIAEPPVALVDSNADKHGTREIADAYLNYLYSEKGQALAAKHFYRPYKPEYAAPKDIEKFKQLRLFTIDAVFGGWDRAHNKHFAEGAIFDQIFEKKP